MIITCLLKKKKKLWTKTSYLYCKQIKLISNIVDLISNIVILILLLLQQVITGILRENVSPHS